MSIAEKLTTIAENVPKVYEAGQLAMKNFIENSFTYNWSRGYYAYAFMQQDWSGFVFSKPIKPSGSVTNMFNAYKGKYLPKNIDLSAITSMQRIFYHASNLVKIDCMGMPAKNNSETFAGCSSLKEITGFNVTENITFDKAFNGCSKLEKIEICGTIGSDISFAYSPLTVECINHIISCLKNYSETNTTHTLTLKADRENMLTDEEKAIATNKGWTLVWG